MSPAGLYVTGTDTGVGKTVASAALLHALRAQGLRAVGMKPVASGCELVDGEWRNADALALQAASEPQPSYADLNPFALPQPLAPELAARDAGVAVERAPIRAAYARLATRSRSPASRARAWSSSCAYWSGLRPARAVAANIRRVYQRAGSPTGASRARSRLPCRLGRGGEMALTTWI